MTKVDRVVPNSVAGGIIRGLRRWASDQRTVVDRAFDPLGPLPYGRGSTRKRQAIMQGSINRRRAALGATGRASAQPAAPAFHSCVLLPVPSRAISQARPEADVCYKCFAFCKAVGAASLQLGLASCYFVYMVEAEFD